MLTGPPTPKDWELKRVRFPRVDWVEGKMPGRAFLAAVLWHVAVIWLLILPIWGFLPQVKPTLAPLEVEMTVYDPPDLPHDHAARAYAEGRSRNRRGTGQATRATARRRVSSAADDNFDSRAA